VLGAPAAATAESHSSERANNARNVHASTKMSAYYTKPIAREVSVWAKEDLDEFGYVEWEPSSR
jgi:hypothetical protein